MSVYHACAELAGESSRKVDLKTFDELYQIGTRTNNRSLLYQVFLNQLVCYSWMGDHAKAIELSLKHKAQGQKRISEPFRIWLVGISSMNLARQTQQDNYKKMGEDCVKKMLEYERISTCNYSSMSNLLQAELHYVNGDHKSARAEYEKAVRSANTHKSVHYEARALELYGIFCMENEMEKKGLEKIQLAIDKYTEWGALNKVRSLKRQFLDK